MKQMEASAVTIIIPVYNAADNLRKCLASIFKHTALSENARILVIDDASSQPELDAIYGSLPDRFAEIIRNSRNMGYTATINHAIGVAGKRDVVLLNSDTMVTPNWLDKLRSHANSAPDIGTVTAVSNNAGEFSVPSPNANILPPGLSTDDMARIVEECAPGLTMDVPTGNGFCMYIRRSMLDAIGDFDEINFPMGYGEENDFCMRGYYKGFKNLIAFDTYIWHEGHASFRGKTDALMNAAQIKLQGLYPDYSNLTRIFRESVKFRNVRKIIEEKLAPLSTSTRAAQKEPQSPGIAETARRALAIIKHHIREYGLWPTAQKTLRSLSKSLSRRKFGWFSANINNKFAEMQKPGITADMLSDIHDPEIRSKISGFIGNREVVCLIDHNWGGGANLYAQNQIQRHVADGKCVLRLAPATQNDFAYAIFYAHSSKMLLCVPDAASLLEAPWLKFSEIFVNELVHWDRAETGKTKIDAIEKITRTLANMAKTKKIPLRMAAHDYFCVCPVYTLVDSHGKYCGLPDVKRCQKCIKKQFPRKREKTDITRWCRCFGTFFNSLDEIICFSSSSMEIVAEIYPSHRKKISVVPHQALVTWPNTYHLPARGPMTIAVPGNISSSKGLEVVKAIPPLLQSGEKLVILGSCDKFTDLDNVIFHGPYQRETLPDIFAYYGVTIGLIPSIWPETFCYVAQECENLRLPFVAFNLGAQGERARKYEYGSAAREISAKSAYEALTNLDTLRLKRNANPHDL